jgi:polyhydroxybutyrate depolymerase
MNTDFLETEPKIWRFRMKRVIFIFGFILLLCVLAIYDLSSRTEQRYAAPDEYDVTIQINGLERTFVLHVPEEYIPGKAIPLVFTLHGAGGSAHGLKNTSHMNATADREGFVVVYPQALHQPAMWVGPVSGPASQNDNDFFKEMVSFLQAELSIDPNRIYVTGISNGGTMTNHLGCIMSDTFAAIAPVAAGQANFNCQIEKPVSVVVLHGTSDNVIPYEGDGQRVPAVRDWVNAWASANDCQSPPNITAYHKDVEEQRWSDCIDKAEVVFYTINGGLHEWFGSAYGPPPWGDDFEPDIYASDAIWDFFAAHTKSHQVISEATIDPQLLARYKRPGDYIDMLPVDGYTRWFSVHIPDGYTPNQATPLVLNMHGYSSTMFEQQEVSGMNAKADQEGFIVVHPQALGDPPSWHGPLPGLPGQADKDFFVALLDYLQALMNIDPQRIYATGLSNGATMSNALGCFMTDTFAAIAPVAGGHTDFSNCPIERPISVLVIHGSQDSIIPYEGHADEVPPVSLWVQHWAQRNGCQPEPHATRPQDDLKIETWDGCDENVSVQLITRLGGDHVWPGSSIAYFRENIESNINATDAIWDFFKQHPRQEP